MTRIAFHSNQLGLRGTEVSLYDYARYNEEVLGNVSIIISINPNLTKYSDSNAINKFNKRFKVLFYNNHKDIDKILNENNVDIFYAQKAGFIDNIVSLERKTLIHSVFQYHEPHGDVYAYISKWLGNKYNSPYVPYIVTLPEINDNLRNELNISKDKIVFGRYGGLETFNIPFVYEAVKNILSKRNDIYFIFMNTNIFFKHKNIIYLNGTDSLEYKVKFINSCDAMLHARTVGETFGLAVAEFSLRNKPVFTFGGSQREWAHLDMLGDKAIKYYDQNDLLIKINDFIPDESKNWNCYNEYNPHNVMNIFKRVFL